MNKFSVGDVVQLKSGGPKMTVAIVLGKPETSKIIEGSARQQGFLAGDVSCNWFDGPEKKEGLFKSATLTQP